MDPHTQVCIVTMSRSEIDVSFARIRFAGVQEILWYESMYVVRVVR